MTNNQFEGEQNRQWYPQLPDGYDEQNRQQERRPVPMPAPIQPTYLNQQQWSPTYNQPSQNWFPGYGQGQQSFQGSGYPFQPSFGPQFPQGPQRPQLPSLPSWQGSGQSSRPPVGQQGGNTPPQNAPPNWTPEYPTVQTFAIDPGAISGCMYRFTYVWLSRRQGFWFYPVFVGRTSVAGYRWNNRRRRWEYTGIDLTNINSFTCI